MKLQGLIGAVLLLAPGLAAAQMPLPSAEPAPPLEGLYIGAGLGVNWLQNEHLIGTSGTAINGSISSHVGMVGVASIGYALRNGLRFELEGDLRNNPIHGAHDLGFPATAGGRERKFGPMVNILYDFSNLLPVPYFSPYVGVGVGYQWARMSGGSEKQMSDSVSVYEVQFPELDQSHLDHWARELGVEAELAELRRRAQLP